MVRGILTFTSLLAIGIMTAAGGLALLPAFFGRAGDTEPGVPVHFESLIAGLLLGLMLGTLSRFHWADIPRRIVTWFLIREREFFYYTLIGGCAAVLLLY